MCVVETNNPDGQSEDMGVCICDRFLGFHGPKCTDIDFATIFLTLACGVNAALLLWALGHSVLLGWELRHAKRLRTNAMGRTLFFNAIALVPFIGIDLGLVATTMSLDRQVGSAARNHRGRA